MEAGGFFGAVSATRGPVGRYGRFEVTVALDRVFANPFDYSQVALRCVFSGPGGRVDTVDGFYMTDCRIDTLTGKVLVGGSGSGGTVSGSGGGTGLGGSDGGTGLGGSGSGTGGATGLGHFAVRYSPVATGRWRYRIFCETRDGRHWGPEGKFVCSAGSDPGFIRANGSPYLGFGDGRQFIPIGENMGWARNAYVDYRRWISRLAAAKGNFIRVWMPAWGLGLEWRKGWGGYEGIGRYQQSNAALLDWLLDYCEQKHVYVMLSLDHHGQVSSRVDPNWKDNPYNMANGGTCEHTWDFFTDARARASIRNRFRYIVARYGYSSHILAWELFNEVDWTDDFAHHRADVADWHASMAAWLRRLDVNHHLITTSFGDARWDSLTWRLPGLDFTQTHYYTNKPLDSVLSAATSRYRRAYGKPTLTGEFGLSTTGRGLAGADPDGVYIHNALWATLLSGAMGPGLPWYWDNYIDTRDLYSCFYGVGVFAGSVDFMGGGYLRWPVAVGVASSSGGRLVRAYALRAADSSGLAGWILNAGGGPLDGAVLEARGMRDGRYAVRWWNCGSGEVDARDTISVRDGVFRLSCPVIVSDKAITAERISEPLSGTSKGSARTGE